MDQAIQVDVLIVGSGPAGSSTALHLVKSDPSWADRIVVVDKAVHPREKLCGGGVTHIGQNILARLGLEFEPRNYTINEARLVFADQSFSFFADPVFRITRRDEFDHWLVQTAEKLGVQVRQGEAVTAITPTNKHIEVVTEKATFHANVLVAADGSRSFVRRKLKWPGDSHVARLMEVLTPEDPQQTPEFRDRVAVFDFTHMANGLQGYYWDFPSFVNGQAFMNRGLFDSRAQSKRPKADLKQILRTSMAERDRDLDDYKLKGHPIRWWDRNGRFSDRRVLLVGDAAGADPLMGEGISFALGYGEVAAEAINNAFAQENFSFRTYRNLLLANPLFKQLDIRTRLARTAYRFKSPTFIRFCWQIAPQVVGRTRWRDPKYVPTQTPEFRLIDIT